MCLCLSNAFQDGLDRPSDILAGAGAHREEAIMQRDNLERLTDIVIGEAVTVLLNNADRINANALVHSLKRNGCYRIQPGTSGRHKKRPEGSSAGISADAR